MQSKNNKEKLYTWKRLLCISSIDDSSLIINVPIDNVGNLIRTIIDKKEVEKIIKKIPQIDIIQSNDKYIENEYRQLLSSGRHEDLVQIIKTAYCRNEIRKEAGKKLSERDGNYFNIAEKLLYNEFSIALNMSFEETKQYIIDKVMNIEEKCV